MTFTLPAISRTERALRCDAPPSSSAAPVPPLGVDALELALTLGHQGRVHREPPRRLEARRGARFSSSISLATVTRRAGRVRANPRSPAAAAPPRAGASVTCP